MMPNNPMAMLQQLKANPMQFLLQRRLNIPSNIGTDPNAILKCRGKRNPDANTCIKLAAFYTIKDHLFPDATKMIEPQPLYSFSPGPAVEEDPVMIDYQSGTDFSRLIDGKDPYKVWPVVDDLVTAVQALHPRLYNSFIDQLQE